MNESAGKIMKQEEKEMNEFFCIDCGTEILPTDPDIDYGIKLNGYFDGRCITCLKDLNETGGN